MVTLTNVSSFQGPTPSDWPQNQRKYITRARPIYDLVTVKQILRNIENLSIQTKKAIQDAQYLTLDKSDLCDMILQLDERNYLKSEWCKLGQPFKNKQLVAAADSYKLRQVKFNEYAHKDLATDYYLKLYIDRGEIKVQMVSIHLDEG